MTALVHSGREEWLLARRSIVTASDVSAILGLSERRSAIDVWLDKMGRGSDEEAEVMMRGRDFEEGIARAYGRQTGRNVYARGEFDIQIHKDIPWLGATLDRLTVKRVDELPGYEEARARGSVSMDVEPESVCGPLQIKMATGSRGAWDDGAPEDYVVQTQIEIHCYGSKWGSLTGLVDLHRPLVVVDMERDDELLASALPHLEEFRWRVENKIPPAPQGERSLPSVKRLYRGNTTGNTIEFNEEQARIVEAWMWSEIESKTMASKHAGLEADLRALLGPDTFASLPDGRYLERRVTAHRDTLRLVEPRNRRRS